MVKKKNTGIGAFEKASMPVFYICGIAAAGDLFVAGCGWKSQCLDRKKARAAYRKLFAQFRRESG